jgi:long-chain acyl-CoA synthetase
MNEDVSGILLTQPELISDVLKPWVESSPEQTALVESSGTWTYGQLNAAVGETQLWLQNLGVRPGDRVMVVCENCRAFVAMFLALVGIDAWPVLVYARLSAREVDQIQSHCGARLMIYTTGVSAQAREHAKRHGAVVEKTDWLGPIGVGALNGEVAPEPVEGERASRVAALIYTSGTTGVPKGVMLTHRNLLFIAAVSANIRSLTPDDRLYGNLPMSHAVGLSVILLGTLLSGASVYLAPFFDPVAALATFEKHRLTIFLGAPATFALLVEYATLKGMRSLKFPALRIISSSGAPLHASLKCEVESLFGLTLHNGYGITECSPNIAQTRIERPCQYVSVGNVLPGVEAKFVGTNGNLVPDGEVGELWVRGPNVMRGYYRAPEETAAAINDDGWFNTRDLAQLQDGKLFIVGRTKELIVRFGFNVYPAEVEGVLNAHPQITRSAVVGRTVEADGNEEIIAFVQPAPGSTLTCDQVAKHAQKHLAPYKQPSQIVLVSTMPLTPTGKVVKEELKKTAAYSAHAG